MSVFEWFVAAHWPGRHERLPMRFLEYCFANRRQSHAQIFQDLLVLFTLKEKQGGFFVEFGATNGVTLSNTYLLEKAYGWRGILAEPGRCWHEPLRHNRTAAIDERCLWSESGKRLAFTETAESELSTLADFAGADYHASRRIAAERYDVETVSLNDLLAGYDAPRSIDYLSVDTEGSEYEILRAFDFAKYDVGVITVEHNYVTPHRDEIAALLAANGYERVFDELSKWDDWYVKPADAAVLAGAARKGREVCSMDIYAESEPLALVGPGWYRVEKSARGEDFRWVGPDASLNVARLTSEGQLVRLEIEPGPAVGLKHFRLGIFEDGARVAGIDIDRRTTVEFLLAAGDPRVHRLSLHAEEGGAPVEAPGDRRTLNFRIFKIALVPVPATAEKDVSSESALADAAMRIGQLEELLGAERRERSELERRLTREIEARDVLIGRLESVAAQARDQIDDLAAAVAERQRRIDELQALADERLNVIRTMHETSETR